MIPIISVSEALDVITCPRKSWSNRQESLSWLRKPESIAQTLGTVLHALIEEIDNGEFDTIGQTDIDDAVGRRWATLCDDAHRRLESQSPMGSVPMPRRWPFFVIKRSRAIERLKARRARVYPVATHSSPEVEMFLESSELRLRGRIDRVEFTGESARIVDHKSSVRPTTGITQRYERQLLLYCLLYEQVHGQRPQSAAIEWLGGERDYIQVTDGALKKLRNSLDAAVSVGYNSAMPKGNPSAEHCGYCSYRSVCHEYLSSERIPWANQPQFVVGQIREVVRTTESTSINVQVRFSAQQGFDIATVHRIPVAISVEETSEVVMDKLSWPRSIGNFDVSWETRCRIST